MNLFKSPFVKIVIGIIIILLIIGIIHAINALLYSKKIEYINVPFYSSKISEELDGYKVVFIADTHQIPGEHLKEIVAEINTTIQPDLVALGGDFPNGSATYRTMGILSDINNKDGIYCVEGNHDIRHELISATGEYGINLLLNQGEYVKANFFIAGCKDLWIDEPDIALATEGSNEDDFILLLAHNPDTSMYYTTDNIDLIASGHTHGGHIRFFGLWAPALANTTEITNFGQHFMTGMCYNYQETPVYVSNGTGYYNNFFPRIFSPPQVIIFELKHKDV